MATSNTENSSPTLRTLSWQDVRADVERLNPALFRVIDPLSPTKKCKVYEATYEYGDEILKNGKFHLPIDGQLVPFDDPQFNDIRGDLGYNKNGNPVLFVLENSLEFFVTLKERIIPFYIIQPGDLYGTWDVFNNANESRLYFELKSIWDMTAGSRSVFMLPKISEQTGHDRLQRTFDFTLEKPKEMRDHWHIFKAIHRSDAFGDKWKTKLLLFSREWFEASEDPAWKDFRDFIVTHSWNCSEFWRSQFSWNLTFSRIHTNRNIKPSPYHTDLVKHLFLISANVSPGFVPAVDDCLAPIKRLQQAYQDVYGMKEWAPIIMHPKNFSAYSKDDAVYYSLQYPSAIELAPRPSNRASVITDTYLVRGLLEKYLYDIEKSSLGVEETHLHEIAMRTKFDFFHANVEEYPKMRPNQQIYEEDVRFQKACDNMQFPQTSTFFKGCVRISNK